MTERIASVSGALELLVPPFEEDGRLLLFARAGGS